jgi:hypothetical protein
MRVRGHEKVGGFQRWSQHRGYGLDARSIAKRSAGVSQPRILRGRESISAATRARTWALLSRKSVPLGKN